MKSSYVLYKPLPNNCYLVRRTTDGELLLAQPLDPDDSTLDNDHERVRTLLRHGAGQPAAALLNHENIVSIHDELVTVPLTAVGALESFRPEGMEEAVTRRMLLYDYCDAGTLQGVFDEYEPRFQFHLQEQGHDTSALGITITGNITRRAREKQLTSAVSSAGGFLPESFIWHVGLGLLRALQWLHEGVRDTYGFDTVSSSSRPGGRCNRRRGRTEGEPDWMPVLHRDVRAENVFLQHPRGIETYGPVKLGRFGSCWVSGGVARSRETPVVAVKHGDGVTLGGLRERAGRWKRDGLGLEKVSLSFSGAI
jgi:serine/threonine protein kinase